METTLIEKSPYIFLLYILIKELIPLLRLFFETVLPEQVKRKKSDAERLLDLEEKELDLRERTVVAQEQIAKALILIQNNQENFRGDFTDLKTSMLGLQQGLASALQGISILLDRNLRLRVTDMYVEPPDPLVPPVNPPTAG